MNRVIQTGLLLVITLSLSGCPHPENQRWADTPNYVVDGKVAEVLKDVKTATEIDWSKPQVNVYSHASPPKDEPNLSIKDISDRGQAAFIEAMTRPNIKPDDFRSILAKPFASDSQISLTPKKIHNVFNRTLVATVTKGLDAKPGDRLMWTSILIKPNNFSFGGYTVFATDNQVINIEHVQDQTTNSIQGQVSATLPSPAQPNVGITTKYENQYTTSADINEQYTKNSVDILPNYLRIYRESERNLDVAGNTLIDLSAIIDPKKWHKTANGATPIESRVLLASNPDLRKNGKLLAPKDANIDLTLVLSSPHCPLTAQVSMIYQMREIISHRDSYQEGEQEVEIKKNATPWKNVEIVSADEVHPSTWEIISDKDKIPIMAQTANGETLKLAFSDFETAFEVAEWMKKRRARSIGKNDDVKFLLGGFPISTPYPNLIAIKTVTHDEDVCSGMNNEAQLSSDNRENSLLSVSR